MILESGELNIQSEIEKIVKKKSCSYMEAVLQICESHNIDPSYIAKHLSKPIVEKIKAEGQALNLLPKSARLPI
jgi:hypothetical protein